MLSNDERGSAVSPDFRLTPQEVARFETFGFLVLRGLFAAEAETLCEGFDAVFASEQAELLDPENAYHRTSDPRYQQETRWMIPVFIEKTEKLSWLREDPRVTGIAESLLGSDYVYAESDGNRFNCDVYWHLDAYGAFADHRHIKLFFYLDSLRHDAGALRVIPGSNHAGPYTKALRRQLTMDPQSVEEVFGVPIHDIPSYTLEVEPGDLIVGDFRTLHGSFNGGAGRRLFTVNFGAREGSDA